MKKLLQDYLPPILLTTYEFPLLCTLEQSELDALSDAVSDVFQSQFISTAPEQGVARYEKIFGLTPYDTDTIQERRFRLLSKVNAQLPFSIRMLQKQLITLCGEDGFSLSVDYNAYTLSVKVALTAKRNLESVAELLQNILPANIAHTCSLLYNQHATLTPYTHEQLAQRTHNYLRTEVLR